ncbi:PIG-L family deacetylase [Dactylosporangium maewongense]|uniref:PIG-L family deacetylase n=1 Tax=Dactylosporangium maewongense TaxID=634393 RepID=A0ABN1ZIV4_9ACTN
MEQRVTEQAEKLGTIVSIWAHPDDETYGAGGIMAAAVANGQRVVCVSATAGELGTDDPVAWPPERLGRTRRWEAAAAMAVLGVTDHRFLGYPDGGLAAMDPAEPVERIAALLADVAPDTVLTFGPDGGTFHPDHQTISAWVGAAWERAGRSGRLLHAAMTQEHLAAWSERYEQWQVFMTDERPVGVVEEELALRVHLTGADLDRKIAALLAMHTQVAPAVALLGMEEYRALNDEEAFVEAR